jgi:2,4-dienoyl-CoA reductase-like NADH-dependent reductase (Old Yellow Enzyme family)
MTSQSLLFEPIEINNMRLKNRLVRSATYEALATEDGKTTDQLINVYKKLVAGGVGLIIQGFAYVQEDGRGLRFQTGISSDNHIPGLKRLVDEVHINGAKICLQIGNAGRQTSREVLGGKTAQAPSAIESDHHTREMTVDEIYEAIDAFGEAARRTQEAGFDSVQFHAAHGYLLAQFLSPYTNRRTDEWGGNPENRMRFLIRTYEKARAAVGKDYPILVKLSVDEGLKNGITIDEACNTVKKLTQLGFDAIEISGGINRETGFLVCRGDIPIDLFTSNATPEKKSKIEEVLYSRKDAAKFEEAYWLPHAVKINEIIGDVPLILVGGMKYPQTMEKILKDNHADLISLCRPLIREPDLPNQMAEGRKSPVKCSFCNRCLQVVTMAKPLRCYNLG